MNSRTRRLPATGVAALVVALLAFAVPAHAATLTVNTALDTLPSGTECQGAAGDCSLRQAIDKAVSGADTVEIPASIPTIDLTSGNGPLTFAKDLTVAGAGAGANTISGQDAIAIFDITGAHTVTISDVTLAHGKNAAGSAIESDGDTLTLDGVTVANNTAGGSNASGFGAVRVSALGDATVDIENSTFSSNHVGGGGTAGGGFGLVDISASGINLVVANSVFTGNTIGGGGAGGFSILLPEPSDVGTIDISGTTFSNNTLGGGGGSGFGVIDMTSSTPGSSISVRGTTFSGNVLGGGANATTNSGGGLGGGIEATFSQSGSLTVEHSNFVGNRLGDNGGGGNNSGSGEGGGITADFFDGGTLTVDGSTFSGNVLGGNGSSGVNSGDGFAGGLGSSFSSSTAAGSASITNNTFVGNTIGGAGGSNTNSGSGQGGGLYLTGGGKLTATIARNTFSSNRLGGNGSTGTNSGDGFGAAALIEGSGLTDTFSLVNNTAVGNMAGGAAGSGSHAGDGIGAGLHVDEGTATFLNDTIDGNVGGSSATSTGGGIAATNGASGLVTFKNTILSGNSAGGAPNNCSAPLASAGHNIESTAPSQCGLGAAGDRVGVNLLLAPLGANGGPTATQSLLAGSPALNGGDNSGCPATDQRGALRPQGACDVGAYEVAPPLVATGAASAIDTTSATLGGTIANPDVLFGAAQFEFGTSTSYGSRTTLKSIAALTGNTALSADLKGLEPGTTYHFREVATNPDGTTLGADKTFKTAPPVPKLSKLAMHPSKLVAAAGRGPSLTAAKTGARVSYRDSQAATTTFTVQVRRRGFRSGKRCVAKRPSHGKAKRCTLFKSLGSFRHKDKSGNNHFHFTGRARRKALPAGRYRLQAVARKSGANSRKAFASFRIVSG